MKAERERERERERENVCVCVDVIRTYTRVGECVMEAGQRGRQERRRGGEGVRQTGKDKERESM